MGDFEDGAVKVTVQPEDKWSGDADFHLAPLSASTQRPEITVYTYNIYTKTSGIVPPDRDKDVHCRVFQNNQDHQ